MHDTSNQRSVYGYVHMRAGIDKFTTAMKDHARVLSVQLPSMLLPTTVGQIVSCMYRLVCVCWGRGGAAGVA